MATKNAEQYLIENGNQNEGKRYALRLVYFSLKDGNLERKKENLEKKSRTCSSPISLRKALDSGVF